MEEKILKDMIERFFNAELTAEEETQLCHYLQENDVPSELRKDKEVIIALCRKPEEIVMPAGAIKRLEAMLDELEEIKKKQIANETVTTIGRRKPLIIPPIFMGGIVAAAIIIIACIMISPITQKESVTMTEIATVNPEEDTFDNPEDAMLCFKEACENVMLAINSTHGNTQEIRNTLKEVIAPYKEMIKIKKI